VVVASSGITVGLNVTVSENIVVVGLVSEIAATDDDDDGHLLWLWSASSEAEKVMET